MKSLKKFGFWSFLIGIVLIVLKAVPNSDIPLLSEESQIPLVLGLILFVCGVLSHIVHSAFADMEYGHNETEASLWREAGYISDRFDNKISDVYTDMREEMRDLRSEYREGKTSCCSTESLNAAGSKLAQKAMNS